jgi:hypothetical protein
MACEGVVFFGSAFSVSLVVGFCDCVVLLVGEFVKRGGDSCW